jgi:hypothetical protein
MTPPSRATDSAAPTIQLGDYGFAFIATLAPQRDASGRMTEVSPQDAYQQAATARLHKYGHGTFCKFRIAVPKGLMGVYAFVVDGAVRYIGECADLGKRFNMGYGNISPRNCYAGGQPTNCKINRWVFDMAQADRRVDVYFYPTPDRHRVEAQLIARYAPPLNGRAGTTVV